MENFLGKQIGIFNLVMTEHKGAEVTDGCVVLRVSVARNVCHDQKIMGSNPGQVELRGPVHSSSI